MKIYNFVVLVILVSLIAFVVDFKFGAKKVIVVCPIRAESGVVFLQFPIEGSPCASGSSLIAVEMLYIKNK